MRFLPCQRVAKKKIVPSERPTFYPLLVDCLAIVPMMDSDEEGLDGEMEPLFLPDESHEHLPSDSELAIMIMEDPPLNVVYNEEEILVIATTVGEILIAYKKTIVSSEKMPLYSGSKKVKDKVFAPSWSSARLAFRGPGVVINRPG
ncbi:hypothetical protein AMTR_s00065p00178820 [Amborella trichopoda]|uniref:Uncharacterized protein n=1 Tax=Amborella trichopoda TaxID=13333 RepID=U5D8W1_AMBTC|nr:hypothetical protein AMTR_s00065p00178820 [Amborella trichopoda]